VLNWLVPPRNYSFETGDRLFAGFRWHEHGSALSRCWCCCFGKAAGVAEPDQVLECLQKSLVIQDDALNYFGAGQLDAAAAVKPKMGNQLQRLALVKG